MVYTLIRWLSACSWHSPISKLPFNLQSSISSDIRFVAQYLVVCVRLAAVSDDLEPTDDLTDGEESDGLGGDDRNGDQSGVVEVP